MSNLLQKREFSKDSLRHKFRQIRWNHQGKVIDVVGPIVEAALPGVQLGTIVEIEIVGRSDGVLGEVVGFRQSKVLILSYTHLIGVSPGSPIRPLANLSGITVNDRVLGHTFDAFLNPLEPGNVYDSSGGRLMYLDRDAPNPLHRQRIEHPLSTGVRAIDGPLTIGKGQRIGVMAGSGVGKSVLMGMIARNSSADINVIALIGERGREVREFIEKDLGPEGMKRSVLITVTSDQSPLMRVRGAKVATAVAEYFSAKGQNVLLMFDSLTRVAMAQREIGNAIGEPPTTKGYTPSVFSLLPRLLERTGPQSEGHGFITGLYTVLVDGDDFNDPIADAARSILDGHIQLSRKLAARNHFPAIDVSSSASRVMADVVSNPHWLLAGKLKEYLGLYQETEDLIQTGAYQQGTNPRLDEAIRLMPAIRQFLTQGMYEVSSLDQAIVDLKTTIATQIQ